MTSTLRNLFGCCSSTNVETQLHFDDVICDKETEVLHFVVPRTRYDEFANMKLDEGDILDVSQYMYLYQFTSMIELYEPPSKSYKSASYVFTDRNKSFWLNGWIPIKPFPRLKVGDVMHNLHSGRPTMWDPIIPLQASANRYENINNLNPKFPQPAGTEVNTSSAHFLPRLAIFSEENRRMFYDSPKDTIEVPEEIPALDSPKRNAELRKDMNAIQSKAVNQLNTSTVHRVGFCVVATPTFNPRDKRIRPKAAKGRRTRLY
ncbi:hypothetical protein ACF0H5_005739 [Mactra antiquata]